MAPPIIQDVLFEAPLWASVAARGFSFLYDISPYKRGRKAFFTHFFIKHSRIKLSMQCGSCGKDFDLRLHHGREHKQPYDITCPFCHDVYSWNRDKDYVRLLPSVELFFHNRIKPAARLGTHEALISTALIVLISPLLLIRINNIYSARIGHFILNTWVHIREKEAGYTPPALDYYFFDDFISNAYLAELWGRMLPVRQEMKELSYLLQDTEHLTRLRQPRDLYGFAEKTPLHLLFTEQEHGKAAQKLEQMGLPADAKIICLLLRSSHYMEQEVGVPDHSNDFRNVNIDTYRTALEWLVEEGYYVLRMGSPQQPALPWAEERIIDYSSHFASPFMDIWLFSHCFLCISSSTGLDALPYAYGNDWLQTNATPIGNIQLTSTKGTTLPQRLFSEKRNRYVSLESILASPDLSIAPQSNIYQEAGIRIEHNTPEELLDAVKEKIALMQGMPLPEEDARLQEAFKALVDKNRGNLVNRYSPPPLLGTPLHGEELLGTVSSVFLRQFKEELLGEN